MEWSQAALVVSLPEAGPSRAPPQKPERTTKGVDHPGEELCAVCHMGVLVPLGPRWMCMELSTLLTTEETVQEV